MFTLLHSKTPSPIPSLFIMAGHPRFPVAQTTPPSIANGSNFGECTNNCVIKPEMNIPMH